VLVNRHPLPVQFRLGEQLSQRYRVLPDPPHDASVRPCFLVPEIGEVLKELIIGNDERRDESRGDRTALPVASRQAGVPAALRPFHEESPAKDFDFAHSVTPRCG